MHNKIHPASCIPYNIQWIGSTIYTVEPVYYGHLGINKKCPDYQGVLILQVSLYDKAPLGTITKCVDYAGILIFKWAD